MRVSVLIPTFRRPESFTRAVRSVFAQQGVSEIEVIAVDNSPEGSALAVCESLSIGAPVSFRWTHAPTPGVSYARNTAITMASGELVAWLDDDEEAPTHWLANLIAVRQATGAQSVFGPVRAKAPEGAANAPFFERLYSRTGPMHSGAIAHPHGIGNSLQPRRMFADGAPFDPSANETGGEDDKLFASWAEAGATFAWAADASVTEHLDAARANLAHGFKRAFAYGQGPCELAWSQRKYASLARHMGVGAAQAITYGAIGAPLMLASPRHGLAMADRAARGAGKVLWFYTQRFYGESQAPRAAA